MTIGTTALNYALDDLILYPFLVIKPTKYSILDFFDCIASTQVLLDKKRYIYIYKNWTQDELFDMAKKYIPRISEYCTSKNLADWLSKDGRFGRTINMHAAGVQTRTKSLWILKDENRGMY